MNEHVCANPIAKSGVPPESCGKLVQYIGERCPKLNFLGLMTIGAYEHDHEPNKDFIVSTRSTI